MKTKFCEVNNAKFSYNPRTKEYSVEMTIQTLQDLSSTLGGNLHSWTAQYTKAHQTEVKKIYDIINTNFNNLDLTNIVYEKA
jgi:hypothetical protein